MTPKLLAFLVGPARSFFVSQGYALWGFIVFAVSLGFTQGQIHDFRTLAVFLESAVFPLFMGIVFGVGPYVRAKQGADRIANTVPLAGGGSAVLQPSVPPPAPQAATATLVAHPPNP